MSFARFKVWIGAAAGVAIAASSGLAFPGVALADNLQDTIAATGSVTLVAGATAGGTAGIRVVANNNDGPITDAGCNWDTGEAPLVLDVVTPTGVTATPDPLSMTMCGNDGEVTVTFTAGAGAVSGTATVSIVSTPAGGGGYDNQVSIPITVTQPPNTGPSVTIANKPLSLVEGNTAGGANVSWGPASVSDDHDTLTATCSDGTSTVTSPTFFPLGGPYTVTCSATDAGGLPDDDTFTFSVRDTTAPTLPAQADVVAEATSASGATVAFNPQATDLVDSSPLVTCVPPSGSTFALGDTTVSCTAADARGNVSAPQTFKVTVQDTTAPTLPAQADVVAEATSASGATVAFNPQATDLVDSSPLVTCVPPSGSTFALGDTTVSCTAADARGNVSAPQTFKVTVQDTTAPTLPAQADVVAEATSASGATVAFNPQATDLVDSSPLVTCVPPSGSTFALGDTTVSCTAADARGNVSAPQTFKVTVQDTTAPTLAAHADVVVSATSAAGATVNYTNPTASDLVDPSPTVSCTPASGATFAPGVTIVSCTATDDAGNTSPATSFKVTVTFDLRGFYQPVDMSTANATVWNVVKNGSTVPLKFEVFAGSTELTSTSIVNQPLKAVGVTCGANPVTDDIELVATGGTALRYDTTGGQFIYNWQTPKKSGACYMVTATTVDGSSISAFFMLK